MGDSALPVFSDERRWNIEIIKTSQCFGVWNYRRNIFIVLPDTSLKVEPGYHTSITRILCFGSNTHKQFISGFETTDLKSPDWLSPHQEAIADVTYRLAEVENRTVPFRHDRHCYSFKPVLPMSFRCEITCFIDDKSFQEYRRDTVVST